MGYYTSFNLKIKPNPNADLLSEVLYEDSFTIKDLVNDYSTDDTKWYDHESEMLALSLKYPEYLFILEGEGERSGDIWKKYFKNGKMQVCKAKITFDEFDESKMR